MKQSHRLLAVFLAVVMLIGVLPLGIFAADTQTEPVVVIAGSDFQDPSDSGDSSAPKGSARVKNILTWIKKDHPTADGFVLCGDLDKKYPTSDVDKHVSTLESAVKSVYGDLGNFFIAQGNHDGTATYSTGAYDTENYGVYLINEDDYAWQNASSSTVKATANALAAYFAAKNPETYTKPIFVATHVPLHYTARTYNDGDGKYAKYLFDVLQDAGEAGFTVIFLHGHDHSQGFDNYVGGAVDFLPVGHKINIADASSPKAFTTETLKFTYMNAGYLGYYSDYEPGQANTSGVDDTLTMSVFTITGTEVTVERYSENGRYANLKSAGVGSLKHANVEKTVGITPFTDVITCPQTIKLKTGTEVIVPPTEPEEPELTEFEDTTSGVSIRFANGSAPSVAAASLTKTFGGIARYKAYEITVKDFSGTAEVAIPIPAGYDASRVAVYYVVNGNIVENMKATVKNGKAVFQTTHFSTYMIAENESVTVNTWTKIEIPGETTYTYTRDNDGIDVGAKYIFVGGGSDNFVMVSTGSTGSGNAQSVTISNNKITLGTNAYEWEVGQITESSSYQEATITANNFSNNTYTLSSPENYYYKNNNGNYRQVTSAVCTRSGGSGNRSYSWKITYRTNSGGTNTATVNGQTITLYRSVQNTYYTFKQGNNYMYFDGTTSNPAAIKTRNSAYGWVVTRDNNSYKFAASSNTSRTIRYNNGFGIGAADGNRVRLFKLTNTTSTTADIYYLGTDAANQTFTVGRFANKGELEAYLKEIIHVLRCEDDTTPTASSSVAEIEYTLSGPGTVNTTAAGTVTYSVKVGSTTVGTFTVTFVEREVDQVVLNYYTGEVSRGAKNTAKTGATITVSYKDGGASEVIDVTVGMLSGTGLDVNTVGVYEDLTVTYNGKVLTDENNKFTLTVNPKPGENDYPEYPKQGAVRVNKTGTPISFKDTGVAEIELSAAGIPVHNGIDVIVMIDTSSSMTYGAQDGTDTAAVGSQRIDYLRNSLTAMLKVFSAKYEDGSNPDVRLALADFNGYTENNDWEPISGTSYGTQTRDNTAQVYTGDNTIGVGAFAQVGAYTEGQINTLVGKVKTGNGTNYDYAFDTIYRLAYAIQRENEANEEARDLYIIFMSDGCPYQFNYFLGSASGNDGTKWNNILKGSYQTINDLPTGRNDNDVTYPYFYNAETGNTHRLADAIKGSPDEEFLVIDPSEGGLPGATKAGTDKYMYTVNGLGATMYSIGFCLYTDHSIVANTIRTVISRVASDERHFFNVQGNEEDQNVQGRLDYAFTQISTSIKLAAYGANFIDTMGSQYDLQMAAKSGVGSNFEVDLNEFGITPKITVKTYDLYRANEIGTTVNGKTVTEADVGTRKPGATVLEIVTFNADGTEAYSTKKGEGVNIIDENGIINAECFKYNTSTTKTVTYEQTIILPNGRGTAAQEIQLPPESFCWNIGNLSDQEFVLSYYVYLTGSMEGTRPAGSYPTNEDATLYYKNWLDHDSELPTVSPVLSWDSATVGFAYYLVDDNGNIIVNRTTGQTGSFVNRVTIADPVIEQILLNNETGSTSTSGSTYLPFGYELFDPSAAFDIAIGSGTGTSSWTITTGTGLPATTYVTGYNGNAFTTSDSSDLTGAVDYTHTTVWFAVRCTLGCIPDIVVVDYGRPVDISVLVNDMFGDYGTLAGIGAAMPEGIDSKTKMAALAAGFGKTALTLSYGSASVNGAKVTFSFPEKNMNMTAAINFAYAVKYENPGFSANDGYYYATVTVVPAATLYFEDDFVEYEGEWTTEGTALTSKQSEDRPGSIPLVDANNVYGFDPMNKDCITYSFGAAKKLTVTSANANLKGESNAKFTFTGTAFDIISVTSKDTGTIVVLVEDSEGEKVAEYVVNTFYGYIEGETVYHKYTWIHHDGAWYLKGNLVETATEAQYTDGDKELPTANIEDGKEYVVYDKMVSHTVTEEENALYQIPVIKSEDFEYGTYTVTITPKYSALQDACRDGSYDFYLDAIRIYNPAGDDKAINDIYYQDNEGKPTYFEVRNNLIAKEAFKTEGSAASGVVFIDKYGEIQIDSLPEYTFYGPNNEVYLQKGEGIAFAFEATDPSAITAIHIGLKAVNSAVTVSINGKNITLNTSTDMYYDLSDAVNFRSGETTSQPVVILANGDGMLSVTNIKVTTKKAADTANNGVALTMNGEALALALDQIAIGHKPVASTVYGDFNVDGAINAHDLSLLRKFFASYDYTTGTSSIVIEGWNPTARDLAKLRKYLAAYDYETGASGYVLVPDEQ